MRRGSILAGAVLAWVALLAEGGAGTVLFPPRVEAGPAPVIDGVLDEASWPAAMTLELSAALLKNAELDLSGARTTLRLFVQGEVLHIGVECHFPPGRNEWPPAPRNPNTGRHDGFRSDPPPFENDHVELYFAPDGGRAAVPLYQVAVDLAGDRRLRRGSEAIEADWQSAVRLEDGRWVAELAVPLAAIGGAGGGHYWHFNACRTLYGVNGQLAQGLAFEKPGYGSPSALLLPGPVKADILQGQVAAYLAAMDRMQPYHTGRDRQARRSLLALGETLAARAPAQVPAEEALAILRTVARTDEQVVHDVILNFLFDEGAREDRP